MALTNGLVVMTPTSVDKTGTGSTATINSNGSVTFSACTSLSLNGVFTSSYDNYMMTIRCTSSGTDIRARLRVSGADDTSTANYNIQWIDSSGLSVNATRRTADGYWYWGWFDDLYPNGVTAFLFGPNLAQPTAFRTVNISSQNGGRIVESAGTHELSTSYTGITIVNLGSNTVTGLVTVFGFNQ